VLAFAVVAGYVNREQLAIKIKSVFVPVTPKPAPYEAQNAHRPPSFRGDAPWALSALPECFDQTSKSTAPSLRYIESHLPAGAAMVRPPAKLQYGDCTLRVRSDEVYVDRGSDHMHIPPQARLYTAPGTIALLRGANGGYELRVYRTVAAPSGSY
jgi:hypothetical protein